MQRLFQASVVSRWETEFNRIQLEREERINQIIQSRKQEREAKRKMIYYLRSEEERQKRLLEEEEARKREGTFSYFNLDRALVLVFLRLSCCPINAKIIIWFIIDHCKHMLYGLWPFCEKEGIPLYLVKVKFARM